MSKMLFCFQTSDKPCQDVEFGKNLVLEAIEEVQGVESYTVKCFEGEREGKMYFLNNFFSIIVDIHHINRLLYKLMK